MAASLAQRGQLRRLQGDLGGAEADLQASLALYRRLGDERACWCVVAGLGEVASASGRWLRAARLLGAAVETGLAIDAHAPAGREDRARMMADAIEALGRSRFDEAAAEGRVWSFEEAMAYVAENDQDADESGSGRPVPTDRGSPRPHP